MLGGGGNCGEEDVNGLVTGSSGSWVSVQKVDRESGEVNVMVEETVGLSTGSGRDAGKVREVTPSEETSYLTVNFRWNAHHRTVAGVSGSGWHNGATAGMDEFVFRPEGFYCAMGEYEAGAWQPFGSKNSIGLGAGF